MFLGFYEFLFCISKVYKSFLHLNHHLAKMVKQKKPTLWPLAEFSMINNGFWSPKVYLVCH